jgi:hypothetical protein
MGCLCFSKYKVTKNYNIIGYTYFFGGVLANISLKCFEKYFGEFTAQSLILYLIISGLIKILVDTRIESRYQCTAKCRDGGLGE